MKRRTLLATTVTGMVGLSGCLGSTDPESSGSTTGQTTIAVASASASESGASDASAQEIIGPMHGDDLPPDPDPTDGLPPAFEQMPAERSIDTASYGTVEESGVDVPLAPVEDVYYWYARQEARFVDARSDTAFGNSHIFGAVSSPVNVLDSGSFDDPVDAFEKTDRIVCYCGCPHHLSSMRASDLIRADYENVFIIDEGFWEWHDRTYPMAGGDVGRAPAALVVRGQVAPADAGQTAWARHRPSGQLEATTIERDGSFAMTVRFFGVNARSPIEVETPGYTVEAPLGELTSGLVTGPQSLQSESFRPRLR